MKGDEALKFLRENGDKFGVFLGSLRLTPSKKGCYIRSRLPIGLDKEEEALAVFGDFLKDHGLTVDFKQELNHRQYSTIFTISGLLPPNESPKAPSALMDRIILSLAIGDWKEGISVGRVSVGRKYEVGEEIVLRNRKKGHKYYYMTGYQTRSGHSLYKLMRDDGKYASSMAISKLYEG